MTIASPRVRQDRLTISVCLALAVLVAGCSGPAGTAAPKQTPEGVCSFHAVSVTPPTATLHRGDTLRAAAAVADVDCAGQRLDPQLSWSSTDTSVAIVDSAGGLIRAKGAGIATIIAALTTDRRQSGATLVSVKD